MYYTYILELENGEYYIGYTKDLEQRLQEHKRGLVKTTKYLKPKRTVFYAAFIKEEKARDFEKYLKSSSGFAFRNKRLV